MIQVHLPVYVSLNGESFLTPQNVALLKYIKETGSLNMASRAMSISYQNAWTMISKLNSSSLKPLVLKQRGGNAGGGTLISDYGMLLLKEYSFIEEQVRNFTRQLNTEINL